MALSVLIKHIIVSNKPLNNFDSILKTKKKKKGGQKPVVSHTHTHNQQICPMLSKNADICIIQITLAALFRMH